MAEFQRSRSAAGRSALRCRTVASMEAARVSSRLSRARRGRPYSSATTSPCSVILMVPSTVPHGCARIASAVGPPPRPTVPPWKSSLPYTDICLYMVRMYERMPSSQPQCTRHAMAVLPRRNGRAAQCEPCRRRPCRHDERRVARAHSLHTATSYSGTRTASHGLAAPALLRHSMQGRFDSYKLCHRVSRMCLGRMST